MGFKKLFLLAGLVLVSQSIAAVNRNPAARVHARIIGGKYYKFTSKLKTVVELNFTLGHDHAEGKVAWDATLEKVATDYGVGAVKAFTIKKFIGPGNGASNGLPTILPTLADFNSAEIIFDNNISGLNNLKTTSVAMATAFETAVKTNGRSVFGLHGSGDGGAGWTFYTNNLHPVDYNAHGPQTPQPVYVNEVEAKHVVNDSLIRTTTTKDVPMGRDATGKEIRATVPIRLMLNEWYRFGRDLLNDPTYGPLTTCFMRYDPIAISVDDLGNQFKYVGGNPYAWMVKVGAGKAMYIPAGHGKSELTEGSSFDGGSGDLVRFLAQSLFFLAGYDSTVCGTSDCVGVPVVDDKTRLTGKICDAGCSGSVSINFENVVGFQNMSGKAYLARLTDVSGRLIATKTGKGIETIHFEKSTLNPGVYFLSVKVGKAAPVVHRYLVSPT